MMAEYYYNNARPNGGSHQVPPNQYFPQSAPPSAFHPGPPHPSYINEDNSQPVAPYSPEQQYYRGHGLPHDEGNKDPLLDQQGAQSIQPQTQHAVGYGQLPPAHNGATYIQPYSPQHGVEYGLPQKPQYDATINLPQTYQHSAAYGLPSIQNNMGTDQELRQRQDFDYSLTSSVLGDVGYDQRPPLQQYEQYSQQNPPQHYINYEQKPPLNQNKMVGGMFTSAPHDFTYGNHRTLERNQDSSSPENYAAESRHQHSQEVPKLETSRFSHHPTKMPHRHSHYFKHNDRYDDEPTRKYSYHEQSSKRESCSKYDLDLKMRRGHEDRYKTEGEVNEFNTRYRHSPVDYGGQRQQLNPGSKQRDGSERNRFRFNEMEKALPSYNASKFSNKKSNPEHKYLQNDNIRRRTTNEQNNYGSSDSAYNAKNQKNNIMIHRKLESSSSKVMRQSHGGAHGQYGAEEDPKHYRRYR